MPPPKELFFQIPRECYYHDQMVVKGTLSEKPSMLFFDLIGGEDEPDFVVLRFATDWKAPRERSVSLIHKNKTWGQHQYPETDWRLENDSTFKFTFVFLDDRIMIKSHGDSYIGCMEHKINIERIRRLRIYGDWEKVDALQFHYKARKAE